ncbi:MerR family transcriptional regulator [Paucimonas lemoignei]|uniref:MerR family transcriptional regulator n=1 Tax=Paucimonas lemoignei TaxID=29443 RepID=UPI00104CA104|nr:helix-turn-helix domain-containing protein [Paucimonas lemoignei]
MNSTSVSLQDFLTVSQAAAVLGVATATLRHWDRTGKLSAVRHPINGYRLYRKADLEMLLQQLSRNETHI